MIGYQAGYEGSTANGNIGIGYQALKGVNSSVSGNTNVAVGYMAGRILRKVQAMYIWAIK